jgi:hypothetical protein
MLFILTYFYPYMSTKVESIWWDSPVKLFLLLLEIWISVNLNLEFFVLISAEVKIQALFAYWTIILSYPVKYLLMEGLWLILEVLLLQNPIFFFLGCLHLFLSCVQAVYLSREPGASGRQRVDSPPSLVHPNCVHNVWACSLWPAASGLAPFPSPSQLCSQRLSL